MSNTATNGGAGSFVEQLRTEYAEEEAGRKWYQRRPNGDGMLYLGARMRDAENKARDAEKLAHATRLAAINILRRYDGGGDLVREFIEDIELRRSHL